MWSFSIVRVFERTLEKLECLGISFGTDSFLRVFFFEFVKIHFIYIYIFQPLHIHNICYYLYNYI